MTLTRTDSASRGAVRAAGVLAAAAVCALTAGVAAGKGERLQGPLAMGPYVLYDAGGSASIGWETPEACPSVVTVDGPGLTGTRFQDPAPKTRHVVTVGPLAANSAYRYTIRTPKAAAAFDLDTAFNYGVPSMGDGAGAFGGAREKLFPDDAEGKTFAEAAQMVLKNTGADRGYCVVYGLGSGRLAWEMAKASKLIVIGLDEDESKVASARALFRKAGVYGWRISVRHVASLSKTPLPQCFANVVVSETALATGRRPGTSQEVLRILRPGAAAWFGTAGTLVRGPLKGAGEWSHQYGTAANAAYGGERLSGAGKTSEFATQWLGRPGADFGLDRQVRMPAPLAVGGRLYHQGFHRLAALDVYNGTVLWSMEIPELMRINIPRDSSNVCADAEGVYAAVRDRAWFLDGRTGRCLRTYSLPDSPANCDWGYVARAGDMLYGGRVARGSFYADIWGRGSWYDAAGGGSTNKVCSDQLFAQDVRTGKTVWTYPGAVIDSTIAIDDGRVIFVESRNPKIRGGGRLGNEIWENRYLVAVDAREGVKLWQEDISSSPRGVAVYFLAIQGAHVVVTGSDRGRYFVNVYDASTGKAQWQQSFGWPKSGHGGHMQRPVVTPTTVFLARRGLDLKTGRTVRAGMPEASCGTYAGSAPALLMRGGGECAMVDTRTGQMSTWKWLRPSCWLGLIAADGMVLSPETGGGCNCGRWTEVSVGFLPRAAQSGPAEGRAQP